MSTWVPVPDGSDFPLANLPYGVFSRDGGRPRVGVAIGAHVLDVARALDDAVFAEPALDGFLAQGPARWRAVREQVTELLGGRPHAGVEAALVPLDEVALHLPFTVADYVDFYSSRHHAEHVGAILRPGGPPLTPNWLHLPIGYHGRAGTVVASGTPVVRPSGQRRDADTHTPVFGPSTKLDFEAEVGFVVGVGSSAGTPVAVDAVREHVFGAVLVNDWSARDLQAWEYEPLGPFLGKSFATSTSPWVVPLDALEAAMVPPPAQDPVPLPYLRAARPWGLDLELAVSLNGEVVARPPFASLYWTPAQQLAHLTCNGARLRTGDLLASGTVSGPRPEQCGSLLELAWNGTRPLRLRFGATRTFLEDGDTVAITAAAPAVGGGRLGFGAVAGTVVAAR